MCFGNSYITSHRLLCIIDIWNCVPCIIYTCWDALRWYVKIIPLPLVIIIHLSTGSNTSHFPYVMAVQSLLAAGGVLALAARITNNDAKFTQMHQLWDSAIIMLTFSYVFPGLQFAHSLLASVSVSVGLIILVAVQDPSNAFAIIVRIGWANLLGVAMSFQKVCCFLLYW